MKTPGGAEAQMKKGLMNEAELEKYIKDLHSDYPVTAKLLLENLGLTHLVQKDCESMKIRKRGEK